ncbi:MAG: GNAT family N-acetyltransferase [Mariprofundaceae bacterium]
MHDTNKISVNNDSLFFHDERWIKLLQESFNTTVVQTGVKGSEQLIHIFPFGPFKVAFPCFPIGVKANEIGLYSVDGTLEMAMKKEGAHCLRITAPENTFERNNTSIAIIQKQALTSIIDLQAWSENKLSSSINRNVNRSRRLGVSIFDVGLAEYSEVIYNLYLGTINHHSGKRKYNKEYFAGLISAIGTGSGIYGMIAKDEEGTPIAYMIIADHDHTAYYLHGGIDYKFQNLRAMDALFYHAIYAAKERKMNVFNMLTSPENQPNLVRYKEKWGGDTSYVVTSTKAFNPVLNMGIKMLKGTVC